MHTGQPQDIALLDARKGLNMLRKVDVPVFGIIENMSYFSCPNCGDRTEIFGHGGAHKEADRLGVDFLGEVPLHLDIRTNADGGTPIVVSMPEGDLDLLKDIMSSVIHCLCFRPWRIYNWRSSVRRSGKRCRRPLFRSLPKTLFF